MSRIIKDEELREYQERIGVEQYRNLYLCEANKVRRLMKSNTRYSEKHYVNSPEKLNPLSRNTRMALHRKL